MRPVFIADGFNVSDRVECVLTPLINVSSISTANVSV